MTKKATILPFRTDAVRARPVPCVHKRITVYRREGYVLCDVCGAMLDPIEVLADIVQGCGAGYAPREPDPGE
ncbi:MAG: hypothetical protein ACOCWR_08785 [Oceanidesulfovibrio sp.]